MSEERNIVGFLVELGAAKSRSDARRLIAQDAVRINGQVVSDPALAVPTQPGATVQIGTRLLRLLEA